MLKGTIKCLNRKQTKCKLNLADEVTHSLMNSNQKCSDSGKGKYNTAKFSICGIFVRASSLGLNK